MMDFPLRHQKPKKSRLSDNLSASHKGIVVPYLIANGLVRKQRWGLYSVINSNRTAKEIWHYAAFLRNQKKFSSFFVFSDTQHFSVILCH